ncbi:MAG: hypothetical protein WC466_03875 [Candidatus Izemoplasmatales bacterium]
MNTKELKKVILEEAKYIKNLLKEKKNIEGKLFELYDDESDYSFINGDSDPNALSYGYTDKLGGTSDKDFWTDERLDKKVNSDIDSAIKNIQEDDIEEMLGVNYATSKQAGKNTTNPVYKKREEKGYIQEDDIEEMLGVNYAASKQAGKKTTNPIYKKRQKKGYIQEEKTIRDLVKKQLFETYKIQNSTN